MSTRTTAPATTISTDRDDGSATRTSRGPIGAARRTAKPPVVADRERFKCHSMVLTETPWALQNALCV